MDPLQIGDRHFDDSRHFVSILSISRQFAGRHFAITFISIYCRHFAEMITYIYICINRKKPLVVYNLFILAKQNVSCYAHVSSYKNTRFSRICEV